MIYNAYNFKTTPSPVYPHPFLKDWDFFFSLDRILAYFFP